jgi:ribosomal-protein-alanine N-acetyltransferase
VDDVDGPVGIRLLTADDEAELLAFESDNRAYFARSVDDRGDAFFDGFADRHRSLLTENEAGTCLMFVVRDRAGRVVGRVNLVDLANGSAELGYRIGEASSGVGYARAAVSLALRLAADRGLSQVTAMTTAGNVASVRVLEASGFERLADEAPAELEVAGRLQQIVRFVHRLRR